MADVVALREHPCRIEDERTGKFGTVVVTRVIAYDDAGRTATITESSSFGPQIVEDVFTWDGDRVRERVQTARGQASRAIWTASWNPDGSLAGVDQDRDGDGKPDDAWGFVWRGVYGAATPVASDPFPRDWPLEASPGAMLPLYLPFTGTVAAQHAGDGWRYEYDYDARGRRTERRSWTSGPGTGPPTGFDVYDYDSADRLVAIRFDRTDPAHAVGWLSRTYSADGRVATETDSSGTATVRWDDHGRIASIDGPALGLPGVKRLVYECP